MNYSPLALQLAAQVATLVQDLNWMSSKNTQIIVEATSLIRSTRFSDERAKRISEALAEFLDDCSDVD